MAFKLYLANTTKQHRIFTYRILHKRADGSIPGAATWPIKPGGQICIDDNFTKAEIDEIISQNVKYGLKSAAEVSRVKNFVGIVYDTEHPVSMDNMLERFEKNDSVLAGEAQQRREVTAAAISTNIAGSDDGYDVIVTGIDGKTELMKSYADHQAGRADLHRRQLH